MTEGGLVLISPDGTETGRTPAPMGLLSAVSPGGTRVAFLDFETGLVSSNLDGTDRRQLAAFESLSGTRSHLAWSPDGQQIVFGGHTTGRTSVERLEIINADGSGRRVLLEDSLAFRTASWSPDGTRIAFSVFGGYYGDWIGVVNQDGTACQRIARHCSGTSPVWSPDGTRIAFSDTYSVIIMDADGANMRRIPNTWDGHTPVWSPDGTQLAFVRY